MIKFNPFTGKFDLTGDVSTTEGMAWTYIASGKTLTVPLYMQMVVHDILTLDGALSIIGDVVVF